MGRARLLPLVFLLLVISTPAHADPVCNAVSCDVWDRYSSTEQVQSIEPFRDVPSSPGLYVTVYDRATLSSRLDAVRPFSQDHHYTVSDLPVQPGHFATGVATDPATNDIYVAVSNPLGVPSPFNGILRHWSLDTAGRWTTVQSVPMADPTALAVSPINGNMYITDAKLGAIIRIGDPDGAGPLPLESSSYVTDPMYMPHGTAPGVSAIAVCPAVPSICDKPGDLVVANPSLQLAGTQAGILLEVPVFGDGTTGAPRFKHLLYHDPTGLEFGQDGTLYVSRLGSVSANTGASILAISPIDETTLEIGCPLTGPVDVAPVGTTDVYVASRAGQNDATCADGANVTRIRIAG